MSFVFEQGSVTPPFTFTFIVSLLKSGDEFNRLMHTVKLRPEINAEWKEVAIPLS